MTDKLESAYRNLAAKVSGELGTPIGELTGTQIDLETLRRIEEYSQCNEFICDLEDERGDIS